MTTFLDLARRRGLLRLPLGTRSDLSEHAAEDYRMQWIESVPIDQPEQADGIKDRRLANLRTTVARFYFEFQPGTPRYFHFGSKSQMSIRLIVLNAPPVQYIPDSELFSIATSAAFADAAA